MLANIYGIVPGCFSQFEKFAKNEQTSVKNGFFFTDCRVVAQSYARDRSGMTPGIKEGYLSIQNPMEVESFHWLGLPEDEERLIRKAKRLGHDGIVIHQSTSDNYIYIAFKPSQFMSAVTGKQAQVPADLGDIAEVATPVFTEEEKQAAMKTSRTRGAVGEKAIVPRVTRSLANKAMNILDFGAGKDAAHAKALTDEGYNVKAYDFHLPGSEEHLNSKYDLVYASNVLNVQPTKESLKSTIGQLASVVAPNGKIIANFFHGKPNPVGLNAIQMQDELAKVFNVKRVPESLAGKNIVWELTLKTNSDLIQRFDSKLVKHVGLQEAVEKGLISKDDAAIIDGIMEVFPDTWKEHFEPRFSEQVFAPSERQMEAHGLKEKDLSGKVVRGALLQEKIGPLKEDAKHLAVIFKHGDATTFLHEFGEFAYKRLTTKEQSPD